MTTGIFLTFAIVSGLIACVLVRAQWLLISESSPAAPREALPAVSILKPLKGADAGLEENLESFFRLDYPRFELIFSFASRLDPALACARRVADRHPEVEAAFVVDGREPGENPKVSRLLWAMKRARHRHVLISDGDVRVSPSYLAETAAHFLDRGTGLVSNPFFGAGGKTCGSRLENLHLNAFTMGGTSAVSRILGRPCVVGKSILISREALDWIGGFSAVKDFLAEDFLLGEKVSRGGFAVKLSPHLVTTYSVHKSLFAVWNRQVRWARMRRRLAGTAYLTEALASPVPWALLASATAGGRPGILAAAAALCTAKVAMEMMVLGRLRACRRLSDPVFIVAKDLLAFGVFWAGLLSDRTAWRGKRVRIGERTLLRAS